jgi:hypothetical protein
MNFRGTVPSDGSQWRAGEAHLSRAGFFSTSVTCPAVVSKTSISLSGVVAPPPGI